MYTMVSLNWGSTTTVFPLLGDSKRLLNFPEQSAPGLPGSAAWRQLGVAKNRGFPSEP